MGSARKYAWVAVLYLLQGWPAGLVTKTFPIVFTDHGVDLAGIGLLSLVSLPWTFKFLWAPLVDGIGTRRAWMASCAAGIGLLVALFGAVFDGAVTPLLWAILLGITILSATQDVAIDAGTIQLLDERELGTANGIRVTAYRVALIVAGGALVILAAGKDGFAGWGWPRALAAAGLACLILAPVVARFPEAARILTPVSPGAIVGRTLAALAPAAAAAALGYFFAPDLGVAEKFRNPFAVLLGLAAAVATALAGRPGASEERESLRRLVEAPAAIPVFLFILLFKIGDSAMLPMTTPFLMRGAGFTASDVGILLNTYGVGATIAGALLGGWITGRVGLFHAIWILGLFQAISNLGYAWAAQAEEPVRRVVQGAAIFEAFCGGLGTAPFLAFLMALCEKKRAATQYAFLSATYVLSGAIAGAFSGYFAESLGFARYFAATFFAALPAFALLPSIRRRLAHRPEEE